MIGVAVMGYGVVGSGVVELIDQNNKIFSEKIGQDIAVKHILDVRDFPGNKYESLITKDFNDILSDPETEIVCETIGGAKVAYDFTKRCLCAGKSVVTSNKELVATHGTELLAFAKEHGVDYMFEAAVGGGIPIIRPLINCLAANRIDKIVGILNGTTNYILTKMIKEKASFSDALKEAQRLGYAEADPSADVDGKDTCRKICILADLAFGKAVDPDKVYTKGIRDITIEDVATAEKHGCVIKLLGYAERLADGNVAIFVSPCAVKKDSQLANIDDVYNGIMVGGDAVGDVVFYGRGAGKFPTASAVCGDVIDVARNCGKHNISWKDCGEDFVRGADDIGLKYLEGTDILMPEC